MKRLFLIISFISLVVNGFSQATQGTRIAAPIVPNDSSDVYPTHDESFGLGGFRTVKDTVDRNKIKYNLRKIGMTVFTKSDSTTWQLRGGLNNSYWKYYTNSATGQIQGVESVDRTIYISTPTDKQTPGSDITGNGTAAYPYATITKALSTIKSIVNSNVTMSLDSGTFYITNANLLTLGTFLGTGNLKLVGSTKVNYTTGKAKYTVDTNNPFSISVKLNKIVTANELSGCPMSNSVAYTMIYSNTASLADSTTTIIQAYAMAPGYQNNLPDIQYLYTTLIFDAGTNVYQNMSNVKLNFTWLRLNHAANAQFQWYSTTNFYFCVTTNFGLINKTLTHAPGMALGGGSLYGPWDLTYSNNYSTVTGCYLTRSLANFGAGNLDISMTVFNSGINTACLTTYGGFTNVTNSIFTSMNTAITRYYSTNAGTGLNGPINDAVITLGPNYYNDAYSGGARRMIWLRGSGNGSSNTIGSQPTTTVRFFGVQTIGANLTDGVFLAVADNYNIVCDTSKVHVLPGYTGYKDKIWFGGARPNTNKFSYLSTSGTGIYNFYVKGYDFIEQEAGISKTLADNSTDSISIGNKTYNRSIELKYSISRGTSYRTGTVKILNTGTSVYFDPGDYIENTDCGVTLNGAYYSGNSGIIKLKWTTTNTGTAATFIYDVNRQNY